MDKGATGEGTVWDTTFATSKVVARVRTLQSIRSRAHSLNDPLSVTGRLSFVERNMDGGVVGKGPTGNAPLTAGQALGRVSLEDVRVASNALHGPMSPGSTRDIGFRNVDKRIVIIGPPRDAALATSEVVFAVGTSQCDLGPRHGESRLDETGGGHLRDKGGVGHGSKRSHGHERLEESRSKSHDDGDCRTVGLRNGFMTVYGQSLQNHWVRDIQLEDTTFNPRIFLNLKKSFDNPDRRARFNDVKPTRTASQFLATNTSTVVASYKRSKSN